MRQGLVGYTGDLGADAVLEDLRSLKRSGTLLVSDEGGSLVLLLARGQVEASFRLGAYGRLESPGQSYHLHLHEPTPTPQLPSRSSESASALLRALPRTRAPMRLPTGIVDLPALLDRLASLAFDGLLAYVADDELAVALLLDGTVRAAVHERSGRLSSRAEALRVLQKRCQEPGPGELELERIERAILEPLLALAIESVAPPESGPFSGLEVDERGYRYVSQGQAFLTVPSAPLGPPRRHALDVAIRPLPHIAMPTEPPGWEESRYTLTLRGKDALNPMTDLNMDFRSHHGEEGQRVLTLLGSGETLTGCAERLGLDLADLKPWVERFESAGFIRAQRG
ncbi:MAG TPA: hypothetical protein VF202_02765 [Trueperaceae bacterium]